MPFMRYAPRDEWDICGLFSRTGEVVQLPVQLPTLALGLFMAEVVAGAAEVVVDVGELFGELIELAG
jgi:hypothetical protein